MDELQTIKNIEIKFNYINEMHDSPDSSQPLKSKNYKDEKELGQEIKNRIKKIEEAYRETINQIDQCEAYISDTKQTVKNLKKEKNNSQSVAIVLQKKNKEAIKQAEPIKHKLSLLKVI